MNPITESTPQNPTITMQQELDNLRSENLQLNRRYEQILVDNERMQYDCHLLREKHSEEILEKNKIIDEYFQRCELAEYEFHVLQEQLENLKATMNEYVRSMLLLVQTLPDPPTSSSSSASSSSASTSNP